MSPRARAVALLHAHGFRVGGEQTDRSTTFLFRAGIFTLRVRLRHGPHAPAQGLWFGVVSNEGLHETFSLDCQARMRGAVALACEAAALAKTLRETI